MPITILFCSARKYVIWPKSQIVFTYHILLLNETGPRFVFKPLFLGCVVNVITLIFFNNKSVEKFGVDSICLMMPYTSLHLLLQDIDLLYLNPSL